MTAPLPPAPRGAWSWTGIADVIRLPFLPLAALLVLTGTALQSRVHAVSWGAAALAAAGLVAMHAAVNALNELSDYRTGIDLHTERTPFSGGSGALPAGRLSLRATWVVAAVSLTTAALVALVLLSRGGYPLLAVLVAGLALTLGYTPWGTRSGVGEVAAGLGLGTLPIIGSALVQGVPLAPGVWPVAAVACLMTFNLLLLNTFPDEAADRAGGRRTLLLLLGRARARRCYLAAVALAVGVLAGAIVAGRLPRGAVLALIPAAATLPAWRWAADDAAQPVPISALAGNVVWNLGTHLLLALALLLF